MQLLPSVKYFLRYYSIRTEKENKKILNNLYHRFGTLVIAATVTHLQKEA